jgi:hypothetical protein
MFSDQFWNFSESGTLKPPVKSAREVVDLLLKHEQASAEPSKDEPRRSWLRVNRPGLIGGHFV